MLFCFYQVFHDFWRRILKCKIFLVQNYKIHCIKICHQERSFSRFVQVRLTKLNAFQRFSRPCGRSRFVLESWLAQRLLLSSSSYKWMEEETVGTEGISKTPQDTNSCLRSKPNSNPQSKQFLFPADSECDAIEKSLQNRRQTFAIF